MDPTKYINRLELRLPLGNLLSEDIGLLLGTSNKLSMFGLRLIVSVSLTVNMFIHILKVSLAG